MFAYLTDRSTPGGKTLEVPRITLEATPDGFKATLQHYTLSVKVPVTFRHLMQIFDALEAKFEADATGWVATKVGEAAKRRAAEEASNLAKRGDRLYDMAKGGGDPRKRS